MNQYDAQRAEHRARASALAATFPVHTWISHGSAAVVHGLPLYTVPAKVAVARSTGNGFTTSDIHVRRSALRPQDVAVVDGIPVTSLARTAVDMARSLPLLEALPFVDAALRRGVTRTDLETVLRHQWSWPRVRHASIAIHHGSELAESVLESVVRGRIILLDLPMPQLQMDVYGRLGWVARTGFGGERSERWARRTVG